MKKHKAYINEWKNVSDDVIRLTKILAGEIFKHSQSVPRKYSKVNHKVYLTGKFHCNIDEYFPNDNKFGFDVLDVEYVLYMVDSVQEYNSLSSDGDSVANSSFSDYGNRKLTIVSGIIGGYMSPDYVQDIMHEVNHLFEYGNGMKKKVNLYDKAVELVKNNKTESVASIVGKLTYMSFPHEIDAFVHQFYGFLIQNHPKGDFNSLLRYSMYNNMVQLRYSLNGDVFESSGNVNSVLKELGMNREQFNKRIHYAVSKLRRKLYNAYCRYRIEYTPNSTVESIIKHDAMYSDMFEKNRRRYSDIERDIESIYVF